LRIVARFPELLSLVGAMTIAPSVALPLGGGPTPRSEAEERKAAEAAAELSELAAIEADILAGCEELALHVAMAEGLGRILLADRDVDGLERVLLSPSGHKVLLPGDSPDEAQLREDWEAMIKVMKSVETVIKAEMYWAAMMSLTAEECPEAKKWPCLSAEAQAPLLHLYRPATMSSHLAGRRLWPVGATNADAPSDVLRPLIAPESNRVIEEDGAAPRERLPQRVEKTLKTEDLAISALCQHFALRVAPAKLEKLVMVWKFNSFSAEGGLELFLGPSMLSHSCDPNCHWSYDMDDHFGLSTNCEGLVKDEEATISYLPEGTLAEGTSQRRDALAVSWAFFCRCRRCEQQAMPMCPECVGKPMSVVMSDLEEPVYPGLCVFCDDCKKDDLQGAHGYFLHCWSCDGDLCPDCGAARSEAHALQEQKPVSSLEGCVAVTCRECTAEPISMS